MNTELALSIVAREVLYRLAENVADEWENYPEIGEYDWESVAEKVRELAPAVPRADYLAAYAYLEDRADEQGEPS